MNKIIALWAVPRSTSTAFEWMMRRRGDFYCLHEPYGEAWYQGENPLSPRLAADGKRTPGLTLASVTKKLQSLAAEQAVFIKDFPHYITTIRDEKLLALFTHSFLIRDPAKTIPSMYDKWRDFHAAEVGFVEQRELFDDLMQQQGAPPPVLDSDDLLAAPQKMVARWCEAVGITHRPESLHWQPGARDEVSWWDGGSFHQNLRNSDGLKPQPRKYPNIADTPKRVQKTYQDCLPHYWYMYEYRLRL